MKPINFSYLKRHIVNKILHGQCADKLRKICSIYTLYTNSYLKKTTNSCFWLIHEKIQQDTKLNMFVFANQYSPLLYQCHDDIVFYILLL